MTDTSHMAHALRLGARGLGRTWPNPAVGCVIVRRGVVIGRGWTQAGGRPHAEVMALAQAGDATGATAYVTLEPCAHHGQTPPCAAALIAARVARVVTALTDPDPRVAGRGHAMLRAAGIDVTENVLPDEARAVHAGFLKRVTQGLPFVTLKLASTLDGRTGTASGESRWITGADARRAVHVLRLQHDAVMIGSGTARSDDPDLTARSIGAGHQPLRIVVDSRLSHAPLSRLGQSARNTPVWLVHTAGATAEARAAWTGQGASLIEVADRGGHADLTETLRTLAARGLTRILCEGGGQLAAALIRAGLVDQVILHSAGALIGDEGRPALGPLALMELAQAPRLKLLGQRRLGADVETRWQL